MYQFRFLISCKVITIFRGKSTTKTVRRARRFLLIQVNEYIYINTHVHVKRCRLYSPLSIIVLDDIIIVIRIQFDFLFYRVSLPLCIQRMKKIKA